MNILAVASPSVSVLSLHHQIHQLHSRILSLIIKKSHSASAEGILPQSVVPEKIYSKGSVFVVIHPHSGREGCRKKHSNLPCGNGLPLHLAFRHQKARRKTLLAHERKSLQLFPQVGAQRAGPKNRLHHIWTNKDQDHTICPRGTVSSLYTVFLLRGCGQAKVQPAS